MLNHFELPTVIAPELVEMQQGLTQKYSYEYAKNFNSSFMFFKQNVDQLTDRVLQRGVTKAKYAKSFHDRPIINGLIQSNKIEPFEFLWSHMGRMFLQSIENSQSDSIESSWHTLHSRVMMTDPSLTMAANDESLIRLANKQREKIAEIWFEELQVSEFSLLPAQLPMLMSELVMDGFVVDLGHEMTQIVPIFGGMTDIRKVMTFPVGGIHMDSILSRMRRDMRSLELSYSDSKYVHFMTRVRFKEDLLRLCRFDQRNPNLVRPPNGANHFYKLPDDQFLEVDLDDENINPVSLYTSHEAYRDNFADVIKPVFQGKRRDSRRHYDDAVIRPKKLPQAMVPTSNLMNKIVEDMADKFPLTDMLFKSMREYAEDEEIKDYQQLKNIVITGGGANIRDYSSMTRQPQSLGHLLVENIKDAILAESVTGLKVILSMDPRLSILQGSRILMNLSSNQKHFVTRAEYYENGRLPSLINQILI